MPWSRLRTTTSGDTTGILRRHSTIDPLSLHNCDDNHASHDTLRFGHDTLESVNTPSPLRNSFEPSAVGLITSPADKVQSSKLLDQPQKRQRFSMLRYRHASDPQVNLPLQRKYDWARAKISAVFQISKTARDHELTSIPPLPSGKLINSRTICGTHCKRF